MIGIILNAPNKLYKYTYKMKNVINSKLLLGIPDETLIHII